MDDLYLENIDEFVNDQNKIVTYKWLSLTLGVHVNAAKQMLYHFLEQKRKECSGTPLHATYLISGKCVENGSMCHKVSVVREDKLEDVKAKMDVTVSVHVYSVQRAELKDSAPLYSTDYDAVKENLKNCNKYSAIRCAAAVPMYSTQLQRVQEMALDMPAQKVISKPGLNKNTSATSKPNAKQPAGLMGIFANKNAAKSQESSKVKTEQKDESSQVETSKTKPYSKANPMSNFFGKSAQSKFIEKPNKNIKEETDGGSTTSATVSIKQSQSFKSEFGIKEEQPKVSNFLKDETQDTRNKTKRPEPLYSEDEKMESQQKKRRRIKKPQADSSDDDDVVPDSPPPVPNVQTTSPNIQVKREPVSHQEESSEVKRRKRRRVLKSQTFVDEEGSFVTKKAYASESYSESEEESEPNSQAKDLNSLKQSFGKEEKKEKGQKKSTAANKETKQPSIMGFFQKK
ncbi:DNA polymerase delta subunit 3-like [Myxocyprinus asiaticus]|uniref:DNA polymerase delta subunit 3-like n=1 Tax=Myxocyprinus asiaticus TaxID=70543 RepID=UPI0022212B88|nr:DNA polymerase delta subunit 3-like [Myxocyprinus asiaticus]